MKKLIILFLLCCTILTYGQDTYTMKFLPQIPQSQWYNATNQSEDKFTLGLPGISCLSFYVYNSGFTFHDVFHHTDSSTTLNMGNLFNKLRDNNYASAGISVALFSLHIAKDNTALDFSINDRANVTVNYPREFFEYLYYGNNSYIGNNSRYMNQSVQVGNFGVNANWYREFALHFAYKYQKWTFGITPKLLFGKTNITTNSTSLKLYSDSTNFYNVKADAKVNIQMSGIPDTTDSRNGFLNNGYNDLSYVFNGGNMGWAGDFGVKYDVNEKLNIAAGLNNIGYIHWTTWTHTYATNGTQSFNFNGLDATSFIQGSSTNFNSNTFRDSINHLVKLNETNGNYTSYLPYDFYMLANYELKHHRFGVQLSATRFFNEYIYAATVCYQLKFGKHFTGCLTYTAKPYSPLNLGGGIVIRFLQMQLYVITDNWYAAIIPLDSKNTNLNIGLNLIFGNRNKNKKAVPEEPKTVTP